MIHRNPVGAWCGYVAVPSHHPAHGVSWDSPVLDDVDVHGGLTWSGTLDDIVSGLQSDTQGAWWFGFDCAHAGDVAPVLEALGINMDWEWGPSHYWVAEEAGMETTSLGLQLRLLADRVNADKRDQEDR